MTIAMERPGLDPVAEQSADTSTAPAAERVTWSNPARLLWVAVTPSEYLGMVDRNFDGFVATSFDGQDLGVFAARSDAQLAVYSYWFRVGHEG